jgi:hypothetical protein
MKPDQDEWLGAGGVLSGPRECSAESPPPPEIVGEVTNPVLETVRRLWWRAFDRVCYCNAAMRLWVFDWIHRPEPATAADLQRETDHERLVRAFPVAGETIDPRNAMPSKI